MMRRRELMIAAGAAAACLPGCAARSAAATRPAEAYSSAADLVAALAARQVSSLELVDASIRRIETLDPRINAVVARDFDAARGAARAADAALGRGDRRPLLGLPMTVKEAFNVAGMATTWGVASAKGWQPVEDALTVARLKAAGAIVLGKTNVPLMLGDVQSYNEVHGTTNNPWDARRTPGGSSGGSAAALAAGYVALELGSDFGGSMRVPTHFCGVYAHRPTLNLVPARGHTPPRGRALPTKASFAGFGPMARHAADLALALDVLAGPDLPDATGYRMALPPARHPGKLRAYRVLVLDNHPVAPTGNAVRAALAQLAERLGRAGCSVSTASALLPDLARSARLYTLVLSSFAGVDDPGYERVQQAAASIPADSTDLSALRVRGSVLSLRDWTRADRARWEIQQQWRELFRSFDVVLCPAFPVAAFPHDHSTPRDDRKLDIDGRAYRYIDDIRPWLGVPSLTGLPVTTAPIARSPEGLPIGVQIIGPEFEDRTPIEFARLIEREFGGFVAPPGFA